MTDETHASVDQARVDGAGSAWVGRGIPRKEDRRLVTGYGLFAGDGEVPRQTHCAILRSPHAHARIRGVDTRRAKELPGVVTVLTGEDARALWNPIPPVMDLLDMRLPSVYGLAVDKVHYCGEPVAAVTADDPYIAQDALDLIEVDYEVLEPLTTMDQALGLDGGTPPLLYEDWPDNRQCVWEVSYGDVDEAFAQADDIVEVEVASHRYSGVPMEGRAVVAEYDPRANQLTVRLSTQFPHQCRTLFAATFDIPEPNVRVLANDVGGGFGNKLQVDAEIIPVMMAVATRRPVKWVERRSEWMTSGPASRDFDYHIQGAFTRDGMLLAVRDHLRGDMGCDGAVRTGGLGALLVGGTYGSGPYTPKAYWAKVECVVTNKAPYGAYRGYGKDIANLGIERLMDAAAEQLALDRIDLRRRNLVTEYPYETPGGPIIESGSFTECLDELVKAMDLDELERRRKEAQAGGRYLGLGIVTVLEPSSASIPMSMFNGYESASVRITPDGQVMALTGMQHIGQGVETAIAQVTADVLGCSPDDVRVVFGDTNAVPYGLGSFSSRGATYGVTAVHRAADEVRGKLLKAASNLMEADVEDLDLGDGAVSVRGAPSQRMTIGEVAKAVYLFPGPYAALPGEDKPTLEGNFVWTNPQVNWVPDENGRVRLYPAHASGAEGALVEVDPETGQVDVQRLWVVHDVGKMINPRIVEAQVVGGMIQGYGGMMLEHLAYGDDGSMLAPTLTDYQLPNFLSTPPVEMRHLETPSPITPLGTKGVGEAGCIGTPTVLMAAVEDALRPWGVQVSDGPLNPERVLEMIHAASEGAA
ncbi:xanthine dehydrogenase family protein molybdopterin-binding subunit [Egibacter rhizosphaerae]|uniref:Xanthine dehydrogenase family protein molybdopterin-binding subunit n=1 Tax=Egibacter rhizosphaerae TaxID=1670831 RepID=A0A411YBH4_9ACTN|nr:xanthine dehydrogenase family protein molybdopterin-binding subunit [Egibacter rhizosphaerae]QBI18522.1 xanthine dehydrogenase family protein molybdopterin-binding subunit [Egibacter rhizosphaerae]